MNKSPLQHLHAKHLAIHQPYFSSITTLSEEEIAAKGKNELVKVLLQAREEVFIFIVYNNVTYILIIGHNMVIIVLFYHDNTLKYSLFFFNTVLCRHNILKYYYIPQYIYNINKGTWTHTRE
jgi:hypothetical protein